MNRYVKYIKSNLPTILVGASVVGVVGTAICSHNAALKTSTLLEDIKSKSSEVTKKEIITKLIPIYALPIGVGLLTVASIVFSSKVQTMRYEGLLASYFMAGNTYKKYRESAKKVYGDNADELIKAEMADNMYVGADGLYINIPDYNTKDEIKLFYESVSNRYFKSTTANVLNALYHLNRQLMLMGGVELNTYYEYLGLKPIHEGYDIGWSMEKLFDYGDVWLDVTIDENSEKGRKVYSIEYCLLPDKLYDEL